MIGEQLTLATDSPETTAGQQRVLVILAELLTEIALEIYQPDPGADDD